MDGLLSIGEFSSRCGLSRRQLRSYSKGGLLAPRAVDPNSGYRYYGEDQLREAQLIDALRHAGMPLAQILRLIQSREVDALDRWTHTLHADADQKHAAVATARGLLNLNGLNSQEMNAMTHLHVAGRTHVGGRESNEDAILATAHLIAIADGMGGAPGGETASTLATELVEAAYGTRSLDELETAVRAANWTVWHHAATSPGLDGMGTTFCAVGLLIDGTLAVANVGDSRAYLVRRNDCRRLTHDHTVTADLVHRGELNEADAADHPHRRILTRAIGVAPRVDVDASREVADLGDRVMVCSDGLSNVVTDEEIATLLSSSQTPDEVADALLTRALSNHSDDNVSVVVADVTD